MRDGSQVAGAGAGERIRWGVDPRIGRGERARVGGFGSADWRVERAWRGAEDVYKGLVGGSLVTPASGLGLGLGSG